MSLSWLPKFRNHVMSYLAQEELNLLIDLFSFSNSKELGIVIPEGILIGFDMVGLVYYTIFKRKLKGK